MNFILSYVEEDNGFSTLYFNDSNLTSYIDIKARPCAYSQYNIGNVANEYGKYDEYGSNEQPEYGGKSTIHQLDDYITSRCPILQGTMRIYDMTRAQYS